MLEAAGFYKGMFAPFMAVGFLHSVYFSGYGATLKLLNPGRDVKDRDFNPSLQHALVGSVVGACLQWVPAVPIDVVKVNLQLQHGPTPTHNYARLLSSLPSLLSEAARELVAHGRPPLHAYAGPLDCARKIARESGLRGLYKGAGVSSHQPICDGRRMRRWCR